MKEKLLALVALGVAVTAAPASAQIQMTKEQIEFYTSDWKGERFPDGRPNVRDDLVKRALAISFEEAWGALREAGYNNQFDGSSDWHVIHEDQPFVGRALTVQYMPARPDVVKPMAELAKKEGRKGQPNIWPISELQVGDVYVADGYGKIVDGTLIGDILGNSIYAKSKNGVVFNAAVRDLQGLSKIEGFNGFVKGFDPSFIQEMQMTQINGPIRIGRATVLPGDIVLAKRGGVIFIPAHLAETVIQKSEFVALRDQFGHQAVRSGQFGPEHIDTQWSPQVKQAFLAWVDKNPQVLPMSRAEFKEVIRKFDW